MKKLNNIDLIKKECLIDEKLFNIKNSRAKILFKKFKGKELEKQLENYLKQINEKYKNYDYERTDFITNPVKITKADIDIFNMELSKEEENESNHLWPEWCKKVESLGRFEREIVSCIGLQEHLAKIKNTKIKEMVMDDKDIKKRLLNYSKLLEEQYGV